MNDLFKTFRLALYVCALPLMATAMVSAHSWMNTSYINDEPPTFEVIENAPVEFGSLVTDVPPYVSQVLHVDAASGVSGRVLIRGQDQLFGAEGLDISLNRLGQAIANVVSDKDGVFRIENVMPGGYTLIASSSNSVATFGVYIVSSVDSIPAANEVQLNVTVASSNVKGVRGILNAEIEPISYSYVPTADELVIVGNLSRVNLNADGSMSGRVVPLLWLESESRFNLVGNNVYLFNTVGQVAQSSVDAEGFFRLESVAPGVYDFVSNGPHGAAAMSIEVAPSATVASGELVINQVSTAATVQETGGFGVVLSEPTSGPIVVEVVIQNQGGPSNQGGYDSGYGGGGGGGGGLGDIGSWIGAALGIWALSEAFDSNDQQVIVPPVVLPPIVSPFS